MTVKIDKARQYINNQNKWIILGGGFRFKPYKAANFDLLKLDRAAYASDKSLDNFRRYRSSFFNCFRITLVSKNSPFLVWNR